MGSDADPCPRSARACHPGSATAHQARRPRLAEENGPKCLEMAGFGEKV